MVIANIILFLSIINFVLTFFVFLNAQKTKQHISFLIFSFITAVWLLDNFLLRVYVNSLFCQLSYGLGILVATFALVWVYNLVGEKSPKLISYFIIPLSVVVFFVSSFSNYIVPSFSVLGPFGYTGERGVLFTEYSLYIGLFIIMSVYKLARKSMQEKDILKKKQFFLIFIGSALFGFFAFVVNFFIPLFFNSFIVAGLVSVTYTPLLLFIIYSIMRRQLFGLKIITTQFLVVLVLSLLLLNFLFSNSFEQYTWSGAILVVSMILSHLIIKSMFKEIELDKKLLEEAKKDLDFEKRLKEVYAQIAEEKINKIKNPF